MSGRHGHRGGHHENQRNRNRGRGGIPDRWLKYDGVGREIEGSRFLPFKTPLDASFFNNRRDLHDDDWFEAATILQLARENEKRIGLVIDLTNTDRYYDKTIWEQNDVKYTKMNCPGHEVSDREDIVNKFFECVDEFIENSKDESLIGVHCTHGLNRTGYLICRYLIDRMGWSAEKAISSFEYSRGHPIERGKYKTKLYEAEKELHKADPVNNVKGVTTETNELSSETAAPVVVNNHMANNLIVSKETEERIPV